MICKEPDEIQYDDMPEFIAEETGFETMEETIEAIGRSQEPEQC